MNASIIHLLYDSEDLTDSTSCVSTQRHLNNIKGEVEEHASCILGKDRVMKPECGGERRSTSTTPRVLFRSALFYPSINTTLRNIIRSIFGIASITCWG